jgi:hypothetical protein
MGIPFAVAGALAANSHGNLRPATWTCSFAEKICAGSRNGIEAEDTSTSFLDQRRCAIHVTT